MRMGDNDPMLGVPLNYDRVTKRLAVAAFIGEGQFA